MNVEREKFFVWNPVGHQPRFVHTDYESALTEAKRLARSNAGEKFYVLKTVALAEIRDPVEVITFDDIPF